MTIIDNTLLAYHNTRMSNIDFTEDNNPDFLLYLDEQNAIPDYVRDSDVLTKSACVDLSEKAFADPTHRLYPCHTKEACWFSAAHFAARHNADESIKANIEKQASLHGISEDVQKVFEVFAPKLEKKASEDKPMRKFALSIDWEGVGGNNVVDYYPINNSIEVMMSSEDAAHDFKAGTLPLPYLCKAARTIVKAASAFAGTSALAPVVLRYGETRLPDPYAASIMISGSRKSAGANVGAYQEIIDTLTSALEKAASFDEAISLGDTAATDMYILDKQAGITYGPNYMDPFSILYCGPTEQDMEKSAANHVRICGVRVPVVDFVNLSDARIDQTFRKEAAGVIKEARDSVKGTTTMEKTANAAELISGLSEGVQKVLLKTLAETCF